MLASRGYFDPGVYRLTFREGVVLQEQKVTYLGTALDQRMTMSPHIEHLTQKATKSIGLQSWVVMARELVEDLCPVDNIQGIEWVRESGVRIETDVVSRRLWRERSGLVNEAEIMHRIMEAPTTIVATDGSLRGEATALAGAVWRWNQIMYEWSAGKVIFIQVRV